MAVDKEAEAKEGNQCSTPRAYSYVSEAVDTASQPGAKAIQMGVVPSDLALHCYLQEHAWQHSCVWS